MGLDGGRGGRDGGLVVARRPIVDGARRLVAFELVHHPHVPATDRYVGAESGVVAVHELLRSHDLALDDVVGSRQVLCDAARDVLTGDAPLMLSPRRTLLQVGAADLGDDPELLADSLVLRRAEGYRIVLDVPAGEEPPTDLRGLVDVLAVDLASLDPEGTRQHVRRLRADSDVLVRGCETTDDLRRALRSGATWFQGRAVQAPAIPDGATIAPSALSQVQLSMELLSRDLEVRRIEAILRGEPALVAQVLDLASTGRHRGLRRQVRTVHEALVVMGTVRLQRWAAVTILGRHGRADTDALLTGLVRARTCELLAPEWDVDPGFAFTAGLLSALDLVLGVGFTQIEARLDIDDDLVATAFRREGHLGAQITRVEAYQRAVDDGRQPGADLADVLPAAAAAFAWAADLVGALEGPVADHA